MTLLSDPVKETKIIIKDIEKEKAKAKAKDPNRRMSGLKIGLWVGFFYMVYSVYQETPYKKKLNDMLGDVFF